MAVRFLGMRPMRILVDRSRDLGNGWGAAILAPACIFQTTDLRKPLSAALLKGYDVLAIAAVSRRGYAAAELAAIELFVRQGGTLILASNAGQFALWTGSDDPCCLAQNAVAELFGYQFRSSAALPMDQNGVRGLEREDIFFTRVGQELGLLAGDVPLTRPGLLRVPDAASVLLVGGRDKDPVAAWSRHGKGKVLVLHDTAMFSNPNGFIAGHFIALVEPATRTEAKGRAVSLVEFPTLRKTAGALTLTMTAPTQSQMKRVVTIAQKLLSIALKRLPTHQKLKRWSIGLETGCGEWSDWGDANEVSSHVGVDASDAAIAAALARHLTERLIWAAFGWEVRTMIRSMPAFVVDRMLRQAGYAQHADLLLGAIKNHPTFAPRLDFSRMYSEVDAPASLRHFWFELANEFGDDWLSRTMKLVPEKDVYKHIDWRLWRELDVMAWLLASAMGTKLYDYLRGRGMTVRAMPLKKPGSDEFGKAMRQAMAALLESSVEPASDRYDAACFLADRLGEEFKDDDKVAARMRCPRAGDALAAALHLAQRRDVRAVGGLERFLSVADKGLRGAAALALVGECGERLACDPLLAVTPDLDTRFQLAAGHALVQFGDERGRKFTFSHHPACSVKLNGRGQIRANPCVDGYEVCNVYSQPMIRPAQYGAGFSTYYVDWVHTAPRWRRRGIARAGMVAGLDWHWDRDCAMTSLHTGTRNVAHALYRGFGLNDYFRAVRFEKALQKEISLQPPKGVKVGLAECTQKVELAAFVNEQGVTRPDHVREAGNWAATRVAVCARQGSTIIGYAAANVNGEGTGAWLEAFAFAEPKVPKGKADAKKPAPAACSPRELVGQAVFSRLHVELAKRGVKKIEHYLGRPMGEQQSAWLLRRVGYGTSLGGGVELYRINSLQQFLREILPTFEGRLRTAQKWQQWCGRITLQAPEQAATLVIDHGKITIVKAQSTPAAPEIVIAGSAEAIQRLAMGVSSAFDECYQIETSIAPMLNDAMIQFLDCLFPRLTLEA